MPEQEILDGITTLIREITPFTGAVTPRTRFKDDLDLDSLSTVELFTAVERAFDVEISYDDLDAFTEVGELSGYVANRKAVTG